MESVVFGLSFRGLSGLGLVSASLARLSGYVLFWVGLAGVVACEWFCTIWGVVSACLAASVWQC